jgi:L-lactate dehydrogenase complex protein LldF
MQPTSSAFKENSRAAIADPGLQKALGNIREGFQVKRRKALDALPEFDQLRDAGVAIKSHTLQHLDLYLEEFERKVTAQGGQVHWARTPSEACAAVLGICQRVGAKKVTKGKSMVSEEIGLNDHLEKHGIHAVETDLGEYIIQLRGEAPSHIIAPAVHLNREDVAETFRKAHTDLPGDRPMDTVPDLVNEARMKLRQEYLSADVGITGANFLIAETGSTVIVTNEGNGDLTQGLPKVHVVVTSIEKVVPTLEDVSVILRLLARSATGQEISAYTTFSAGPKRAGDHDGPEEFHVVLVDNGRSALLGTEIAEVLRCIRCGACMNHCPVYGVVGGHAYGWVYPGPIGAALDPALIGLHQAGHLPNASSFCGRCVEVCPMRIPLTSIMRHWRQQQFDKGLIPPRAKWGLKLWSLAARNPALYRLGAGLAMPALAWLGRRKGRFTSLPLAGGWTGTRDLAAPQGATFMDQYRRKKQS